MFWEIIQDFLEWAVGLREDAANAAGSLHAKVAKLQNDMDTLMAKPLVANGSAVKSIQRGVTTISGYSATVTISPVSLGKALLFVNFEGVTGEIIEYAGDQNIDAGVRADLTSATQITLRRSHDYGSADVSWQVVEFY